MGAHGFWYAENDLLLLDKEKPMNIKIEHKDISKKYKLTVARDEVRIKLPMEIDPDCKKKLVDLSTKVAQKIHSNFTFTQRGYWKFDGNFWRITLQGERRKETIFFTEQTL